MPSLTGSAQWAFKDFSTPVRADNPIPRMNQKGLVERDLTPKEGYYVFQSYWSDQPMAHIYGHSWPVRWGEPQELKLIKVYSNCDTAELFVNGGSCGAKKRNSQDFPAAGLRWALKLAPGDNHVRVIASKNGTSVTDEIRCLYQTQKWEKPSRLRLTEKSRLADRVTIEASLLDANGVLCLDARNQVRFGLTGNESCLAISERAQDPVSLSLAMGVRRSLFCLATAHRFLVFHQRGSRPRFSRLASNCSSGWLLGYDFNCADGRIVRCWSEIDLEFSLGGGFDMVNVFVKGSLPPSFQISNRFNSMVPLHETSKRRLPAPPATATPNQCSRKWSFKVYVPVVATGQCSENGQSDASRR